MSKSKQAPSSSLAGALAEQTRQLALQITRVDVMPKKRKDGAVRRLAEIEKWLEEAASKSYSQPLLAQQEDPPEGGGGNPNG